MAGRGTKPCGLVPISPVSLPERDPRLTLWNIPEMKTKLLPAHEGCVASLAVSPVTGVVASASYDKIVKPWK
ncbi:hypothetical protein L3X38_007733 [Prunus dulcis]|uniref:Transducin/WD40 repeat-like superfamily protein n=1 Tax=Prunus dulcis TaxID=3755 RepID=A0AAD4ZV56_PRUDU|nr:hypothetical protein L3X38_007733 [Prunus dulcis]